MIDLYPSYEPGANDNRFFSHLNAIFNHPVMTFFSARSAMVTGLGAFGLSRMDEILVPPFLGHCILTAISRTSFPTMTASRRTKAILVFHQFGFPQKIKEIESIAREQHWLILNDCAHTLFSRVYGNFLVDWGDLTAISFSKIFSCGLGGGLWSRRSDLSLLGTRDEQDAELATEAFKHYLTIQNGCYGEKTPLEIQSLYGYLPDIKAIAPQAADALPGSMEFIQNDIARRKRIYAQAVQLFGDRVPKALEEEIVPFAIPVCGEEKNLYLLSSLILKRFNVEAPVLHFDYACNMLNSDYKKALVIGCHSGWREEMIDQIFALIRKEM